jgi:hypothetical protein
VVSGDLPSSDLAGIREAHRTGFTHSNWDNGAQMAVLSHQKPGAYHNFHQSQIVAKEPDLQEAMEMLIIHGSPRNTIVHCQ